MVEEEAQLPEDGQRSTQQLAPAPLALAAVTAEEGDIGRPMRSPWVLAVRRVATMTMPTNHRSWKVCANNCCSPALPAGT